MCKHSPVCCFLLVLCYLKLFFNLWILKSECLAHFKFNSLHYHCVKSLLLLFTVKSTDYSTILVNCRFMFFRITTIFIQGGDLTHVHSVPAHLPMVPTAVHINVACILKNCACMRHLLLLQKTILKRHQKQPRQL